MRVPKSRGRSPIKASTAKTQAPSAKPKSASPKSSTPAKSAKKSTGSTSKDSSTISKEARESKKGSGSSSALDRLQEGLDWAGLAPGVGNIADIANAGISTVRGLATGEARHFVNAATSAGAALPGGQAITAAKFAAKARAAKLAGELPTTPLAKPKGASTAVEKSVNRQNKTREARATRQEAAQRKADPFGDGIERSPEVVKRLQTPASKITPQEYKKHLGKGGGQGQASKFKDLGKSQGLIRKGWAEGTPVRSKDKSWKVYDAGENIGVNNGKDTQFMRIEATVGPENPVHGHPISERDYMKYLKLKRR